MDTITSASLNGSDIYILKCDYTGSEVWKNTIGGGWYGVYGHAITADHLGNTYVCGAINSYSAFIYEVNDTGNMILFKYINEPIHDPLGNVYSIGLDQYDNLYITGIF